MDSTVSATVSGRGAVADRVESGRSLEVRELGRFEVRVEGQELALGGPKQRAVLALLALAPDGLTVDRLIEGVWGENAPDAASSSVYSYVSNLRAALGGGIERERGIYRITYNVHSASAAFEEAAAEADQVLSTDPGRASTILRDALAMWHGLPYADLTDIAGLHEEARRLEELRVHAVEQRLQAELEVGKGPSLVPELQALVAEHPLRERFRAQLMLALFRSGRQAEALRACEDARRMLRDELGVDPSQELRELELRILEHDGGLRSGEAIPRTQRLAFLFTDIEGSTRLWNSRREHMAGALALHDQLLGEAVESEGGVVFKHTGDGALSVFPGTEAAAKAAEKAQRALQGADFGPIGEIEVRMAIDFGDVDVRDGDYYGPPLNRCARLLAAAHGGQVLLSSAAYDALSSAHPAGMQLRQLGAHQLRGLGAPERLAQLVFVGLRADFPAPRPDAGLPDLDDRLELGGLPGYELRERLGAGIWGSVYRAYQPSVGREVAVRVIPADLSNRPTFVRRFEAHARTVAQLEHPHIVPLHDFWRGPDGAYLVMQLMRGGNLAGSLRGEPWKPSDVVGLLRQIGAALSYAHSEGAVHGDLRPTNVLFDGRGNAFLSGFGYVEVFPKEATLHASRQRYIPPEARNGGVIDPRVDVYSLAVLVHELLTGTEPPLSGPLPPTMHTADGLDAALLRGSAANPAERITDVVEFVATVESALKVKEHLSHPPLRTALRNPFKGLRPFHEGDAGDFHGRSDLVDVLVDSVGRNRLTAVVGPSGSGKSSVVAAGLVPRLRAGVLPGSETWFVATCTPGPHPVAALSDAIRPLAIRPLGDVEGHLLDDGESLDDVVNAILPDDESELVLFVDQFEELFTLTLSVDERARFVALLEEAAESSRVRTVLTLRADFYGRPLEYPGIASLVADGLVTVVPPTLAELIQMIERPALGVGLGLEPGLPMRIAGDVVGQRGGLPLLQYALTQMVEHRSADRLTGSDYEAIGEVKGAVANRAEAVYATLDDGERDAARSLFLRLVTVDEEADDTRRRAKLGELDHLGHHPRAVQRARAAFGGSRLLLFDRDPVSRAPTVEVAHEALLREWGRLRDWIEGERESLILARRLRVAMGEWDYSDRSGDFLLTGDRLAPFRLWATSATLSRDEQDFFDRSIAADEALVAAAERRRRLAVSSLSIAVLIMSLLALWALGQSQRANDEADRANLLAAQEAEARDDAEHQAEIAEEQTVLAEQRAIEAGVAESLAKARELAAAAVSIGDEDPQLSMLLALEALDVAPKDAEVPIEVSFSLREAMYANRLADVVPVMAEPGWLRVSGEGRWMSMISPVPPWDLRLFDLKTMDEQWVLGGAALRMIGFSPDERWILTTSLDRLDEDLLQWNPHNLELRSVEDPFDVTTIPVECPTVDWGGGAWSPDGSVVAYPSEECGALVVVETDTWTEVHRLPVPMESFLDVFFASDPGAHRMLLNLWRGERAALVFDTSTWEEIAAFDTPIGIISPDGETYYGMEWGENPRLFSVESGEPFDTLTGSETAPNTYGALFSPDGQYVMVPTEGSMVPIWDTGSGDIVFRLPAGQRAELAFVDDRTLVSVAGDGTMKVWDLTADAGELHTVDTGSLFGMRSAFASETVGAIHGFDSWVGMTSAFQFDPRTGELGERRPIPERAFPWVGALGDLGVVFGETRESDGVGQVVAWDGRTGEEVVLFDCVEDGPGCVDGRLDHRGMFGSIGGSEYGLLTTGRMFLAWDSEGNALPPVQLDYDEAGPTEMLMSFSSEWIVVRNDWSYYNVFDRQGSPIAEFTPFDHGWLRFDRTGRHAIGWGFDESTSLIDTSDWSYRIFTEDLGGGSVRDATFSPSGDLVSLGVQGGPLRVFTFPDGELVARIPLESVVSSYWVDEDHLAVVTRDGTWTVVTLDLAELRELAAGRVLRDFTSDECRTYRIDSCEVESDE